MANLGGGLYFTLYYLFCILYISYILYILYIYSFVFSLFEAFEALQPFEPFESFESLRRRQRHCVRRGVCVVYESAEAAAPSRNDVRMIRMVRTVPPAT